MERDCAGDKRRSHLFVASQENHQIVFEMYGVDECVLEKFDETTTEARALNTTSQEAPVVVNDTTESGKGNRKGFYSVLHYAAAECSSEVVETLLKDFNAHRHVNTPDACGCTPLHWAASVGKLENVELLLLFGASDQLTNYMGKTPLQWTQMRNSSRIAEQLKELQEKKGGTLMDRDDGACADKIDAHDVMRTVAFLKERKVNAAATIDIKRIKRHMTHASASGHLLTTFSQQLLRYQLPSLLPQMKQSPKLKQLTNSVSEPAVLPGPGVQVKVDKEFWCTSEGYDYPNNQLPIKASRDPS